MIRIGKYNLYAYYIVNKNKILAYSLHYKKEECRKHLEKIKEFHNLDGEIIENKNLDKEFEKYILEKIEKDITPKFIINQLNIYKGKEVYEKILKIKKGSISFYSNISKRLNTSIWNIIRYLKYNPFIILIPCHRIIRKDRKISGYTPLGKEFKEFLLKIEGYL